MQMSHHKLSKRSRARGVASIEALATLPVFVVLFVSVFYVQDLMVERQKAETQARSCAWLYSANNCTVIPEGCGGIVQEAARGDVETDPKITDRLEDAKSAAIESGGDGTVAQVIGEMLGPVLEDTFGRSLDASSSRTVNRPLLYGGDTTTVNGRYHLGCNLSKMEPVDVAKDAWDTFKP